MVYADKERLHQVISNLFDNSLKLLKLKIGGGRGGKDDKIFSVLSEIKDNHAQISVKDSGPGVDPEVFPRLFTRFASKSFSGTGLGLYLCKKIVESHGGRISGKNNADGIRSYIFI